jgi:hypothetical protein
MKRFALFAGACIISFVSCATQGGSAGGTDAAPGALEAGGAQQVKPVESRREFVKIKEQVFFAEGSAGKYTAGTLDEYTVSEWDPSLSNLVKETRYSASDAVLETTEYTYQGNNPVTKITKIPVLDTVNNRTQAQDQIRTQVEYTYSQGLLQKETLKNKDGAVVSVYEYTYDSQGNRTGRVWKNGKDTKLAEIVSVWTDGKLMSSETKNAGGSRINSTEYQYDSQGNQIKQESRGADGKTTSTLVSAWQNGLDVQDELSGADNAAQQREINTYGPDGELTQKIIENLPGKSAQIIKYEYKFK